MTPITALCQYVGFLLWFPISSIPWTEPSHHPIVVLQVHLHATLGKLSLDVECALEDYFYLYPIERNRAQVSREELQTWAQEHPKFLLEHLRLTAGAGEDLPGRLIGTEFPLWPPAGISLREVTQYRLRYFLEYPLAQAPEVLSLHIQPARLLIQAEVNISQEWDDVRQQFRLNSEDSQELRFDWPPAPNPEPIPQTGPVWPWMTVVLVLTGCGLLFAFRYRRRLDHRSP
jgi:hypothetical protein